MEPNLVVGDRITATQTFDGVTSLPSYGVVVRSHKEDYPDPDDLPKPYISRTPLYECGKATAIRNIVPGAHLRVFAELPDSSTPPVIVGEDPDSGAAQAVHINPMFVETERITAQYQICEDISPLSDEEIVLPAPATLPVPTVDKPHEGADLAVARNIVNGAVVDIYSGSNRVGGGPTSGGSGQPYRIDPRAGAGDKYRANQRLCGDPGPWSPEVTTIPCAELPPATIRQPVSGDDTIHVTHVVPGSRIAIFVGDVMVGGEEIGDGGGSEIRLIRPLGYGEIVRVVQKLGDCVSRWMYEIETGCAEPTQLIPDSSDDGMYDVGRLDYNLPPVLIRDGPRSLSARIAASVRYPVNPATGDIIRRPRKLPLVVLMHGSYSPNSRSAGECVPISPGDPEVDHHEGFDYVLDSLARGGFIAVSINANDTGCWGGDYEIRLKKEFFFRHLALWKRWNNPSLPDSEFSGSFHDRVDLSQVGLIGHSMGGETVVVVAQAGSDPAITISAVVAVAPTSWTDMELGVLLEDIPLLVVTGTNDASYWPGGFEFPQKIYDRSQRLASGDWFKSMVIIDRGIHDYFTRSVTEHIHAPDPVDITRPSQEAILRALSRSFFELTLHAREDLRPVFTGGTRVSDLESHRLRFNYRAARDAVCQ